MDRKGKKKTNQEVGLNIFSGRQQDGYGKCTLLSSALIFGQVVEGAEAQTACRGAGGGGFAGQRSMVFEEWSPGRVRGPPRCGAAADRNCFPCEQEGSTVSGRGFYHRSFLKSGALFWVWKCPEYCLSSACPPEVAITSE